MKQREPSHTVSSNVNWCSHRGKQYGSSSKTKNRVAIWSSNPTLGHILRQNYNLKRYMHLPIFTAALFMTAKYGSNLNVYQQLNGQRRCSVHVCVYIYTHCNISHKKEWNNAICNISSVQFSHSVISDSLRPHELQHVRPPWPSPTPGVHPKSCRSSRWCHPAISSSVVPFSCP